MSHKVEHLWVADYHGGEAAENARLRARCQAALSALRLLSDELSYILATPLTAGDLARARGVLAKARLALEHAEPPEADQGTPICARCQAAESALRLVLAAYDLNATEDEDLCHHLREPMDATRQVLERALAPDTAWAPHQGGDLPQMPKDTREGESGPRTPR